MKLFKDYKKASQKLTKQEVKRYNNLKYTLNKMGIKHNLKALNQQVKNKSDYLKAIQKMEYSIEKERIKKLKKENKIKGLQREYDFYKTANKYKSWYVKEKLVNETYKNDIKEAKKIKDTTKRERAIRIAEIKYKKEIGRVNYNLNIQELNKLANGSYNGKHIQNKSGLTKKIEDVHDYNTNRTNAQKKLRNEMKQLKKTNKPLFDFLNGNIPKGIKLESIKEAEDLLIGRDNQKFDNVAKPEYFNENYMFYQKVNEDYFSLEGYLKEERKKIANVFVHYKFAFIPNAKKLSETLMTVSETAYYKFYERYGGKKLGEIYAMLKKMDDYEANQYIGELIEYVVDVDQIVNDYYS